jgi:predicted nuclease of restriction endonuclease-like (RecB) superfamily
MKKRFLKVNNNMMDYPLKNLILHYVAEEDLAQEMTRDPYSFDFLTIRAQYV